MTETLQLQTTFAPSGKKRKRQGEEKGEKKQKHRAYSLYTAESTLSPDDFKALESYAEKFPWLKRSSPFGEQEDYYFVSPHIGAVVWPIQESYENKFSVIARQNHQIIGFVTGHKYSNPDPTKDIAAIDYVDLNHEFIGKNECVPLLANTFQLLFRKYPELTTLYILNASKVKNGIPACICYIRAGKKMNLRIERVNKIPLDEKWCTTENPKVEMYYHNQTKT